ncbi:MAG: helix-turn-helix domain-containing protein [Methylotenera sp.]|nr:helix-turn-helix domain-containing protein [Methylotenera sp.]
MKIKSERTKNKELAASTTNPLNYTRKTKFTDNSTNNQRLKLLDYLQEHGSITTAQARDDLDVMSPAPRIMELRRFGYLINTISDSWISDHGINHKGIARYVLMQTSPIASEVA